MAETSKIEWTDATWNPVTGCSVTSPGCTNCYAMRLAGTRMKHHRSRAGLTRESKAGPVWTGEVRLNEGWLDQPLRWKRKRRIFVCAHGDLFHEAVPEDWIAAVFGVMAAAPQHTFQVLTKRPDRMRAWFAWREARIARLDWQWEPWRLCEEEAREYIEDLPAIGMQQPWPLPNVWLGVSAEDQARADERIPHLLQTPAALRFVSAEPLLGPVDLASVWVKIPGGGQTLWNVLDRREAHDAALEGDVGTSIDWIIAGGESGPGARPMHPDWVRGLRDQCEGAGVPFFFKQHGEWLPTCDDGGQISYGGHELHVFDPDGPHEASVFRVGKKAAGALLDGTTHRAWPR